MIRVLVTGVGSGIGQSILKCFQDSDYKVVGADADPLAAGLYAVPKSYRIPLASAPDYVPRLLELCCAEGCKLIFPGVEPELMVLARSAIKFRTVGIIPVVCDPNVITLCDDKLATAEFLSQRGFKAPRTLLPEDAALMALSFPVVLKPKAGGARSRGVFLVHTREELDTRLSEVDRSNYVVQEYLPGDDYTCGSVTFEGRCYGTIVMRRTLRDGDTYKAFVINDPIINDHVRRVAEELGPFGACNFQLRLKDGDPYIFEINSRCSGTTYGRACAGFNEPVMIADFLLKGKTPSYSVREVTILRYWKELLVENSAISTLEREGSWVGSGGRL
jgi:carbamoyl-phosphate synthase large subunit